MIDVLAEPVTRGVGSGHDPRSSPLHSERLPALSTPAACVDLVAKAVQECQNGLTYRRYHAELDGVDGLDLAAAVADYAGRVAAAWQTTDEATTLRNRTVVVDIGVRHAELVVSCRRHRALAQWAGPPVGCGGGKHSRLSSRAAVGVAPAGDDGASALRAEVDDLVGVYRRVETGDTDKLSTALRGDNWLAATIASDVANRQGDAAVPEFVYSANCWDDWRGVTPVDAQTSERWEDRISVDEYALFEATHPAYGVQTAVVAQFIDDAGMVHPPHVLDIGSGPGLPTRMLAELFPSSHIDAVEPSATALPFLKANTRDLNVSAYCEDIRTFDAGRQYPVIVSVGASHHLDTALFFRSIARLLAPGGVAVIADEMISPFADAQQRARNVCAHHRGYIVEALENIDVESLPEPERVRLQQLRDIDWDDPASVRSALVEARVNRLLYRGDRSAWPRVRFAVLELEALVAGMEYDVERKTWAANLADLARTEGLTLRRHERVYATTGVGAGDGGTHVFAFTADDGGVIGDGAVICE